MSKFFKALQQAEQDRRLLESARRARERVPETVDSPPAGPSTVPAGATEPATETAWPRPKPPQTARPETPRRRSQVDRGSVGEHLISLLAPTSYEAEQYRALRHLIEQRRQSTNLSVVGVTSPTVGDGKTTTAINLAGALAQGRDARVLLVDADLRRPSVAEQLGLHREGQRGLTTAILDAKFSLEEVVVARPVFNMTVLPAGPLLTAPFEALKSPQLAKLFQAARSHYDYIVVDSPPMVHVPDCRVLSECVDGFLMVVAAHQTPRKLLEEALNAIDPAKMVGFVFNGDDRPLPGYYTRYYHGLPGETNERGPRWAKAARRMGRRLGGGERRNGHEEG
jgi:capsular exopolysaccharide synthesis family protein